MNNNQIVVDAVAAHNANLAEQTKAEGIRLVSEISERQARIQGCKDRIAESQKALLAISSDVIDEASIFGGSIPENANKETIAKVIEQANKARQFDVEQRTSRLTKAITSEQSAIKEIERQVAELVEKLAKLAPPVVTTQQIVG